jgi:signal transduction histidine kinase
MAAALEGLDAAKSDFVANVSHELRTPLTAMRLSIANLLDGMAGEVDERARATLERLRRDAERMVSLVSDLLELARIEAGAVLPRKVACDLAALACECAAAVAPLADDKRISIEVKGEGIAEADPALLRRVVTNLLDNAVRFTPAGGRVAVVASGPELRVSDTGPGLNDPRLFEKFVQGSQDGVKHRGVGLGLTIVKKLIDLHGGSVRLEPGEGATFVIRL